MSTEKLLKNGFDKDSGSFVKRTQEQNAKMKISSDKNCESVIKEESNLDDDIFENKYDRKHGKIFRNRDSLITVLFQSQNFKTILNLCLISLGFVMISSGLNYFFLKDESHNEIIDIFTIMVVKFPQYLLILIKISVLSLLFYPVFYILFHLRTFSNKIFYTIWISVFGLGFVLFTYYSYKEICGAERIILFIFMLAMEQVRLVMKVWAFLHENIKKIKIHKENHDEKNKLTCPSFSKFLYFLFIPTAVYRDNYPKRATRNMQVVLTNSLEVIGSFIGIVFIYHNYVYPELKDFGIKKISVIKFMIIWVEMAIPVSIISLLIFFSFLHCWMNLWAEMLKYGDRLFYTDWWNSNSYSDYYKKWNIVVQDWLRTYLFNEIRFLFPKKIANNVSSFFVIMISAIIHEYIAYLVVGSFCPAFLIQFGVIGMVVKFFKPKNSDGTTLTSWNIFLLSTFMLGNSVFCTLYSAEYFANINCPYPTNTSLLNKLIPRFLTANCY